MELTQDRYFIYALFDSFDKGIPKYVGQTKGVKKRFLAHTKHFHFTKTKKSKWVSGVKDKGGYIEMGILKFCTSREEANLYEKKFIADYRAKGYPLVNSTDGGSGTKGYKFSAEHLKRMSIASMGKARHTTPHTLLTKQKISAAKKGRIIPREVRIKMSQAHRGKKRTPEQRANMRAAWVLRKLKYDS